MKQDWNKMTLTWTQEDDEGYEVDVSIPAKADVCGRCDGAGTHDNPAFSNGFTSDEMYEMGDDFCEGYVSGVYDVQCETCKGRTTVLVPDEDRADPDLLERYYEWCDDMAAHYAECEAERRMGC